MTQDLVTTDSYSDCHVKVRDREVLDVHEPYSYHNTCTSKSKKEGIFYVIYIVRR